MFDPDLAIAWMGREKSRRLANLRRTITWASGATDYAVSAWINMLQPLGIADVNWESGDWSARPFAVTALPGRTNVALLTGSRPLSLLQHPQEGLVVRAHPSHGGQVPLPSTAWLQYSSYAHLQDTARILGAKVAPCAAETLASSLSRVKLGAPVPGPSRTTPLKRFDRRSGSFRSCAHISRPEDGLYEYKLYGRLPRYASRKNGQWHAADKLEGIFLELPLGSFPLRWVPERRSRYSRSADLGQLVVDHRTDLPARYKETAVMCTGLPPVRTKDSYNYDGVPRKIAERIARTLRRRLETE